MTSLGTVFGVIGVSAFCWISVSAVGWGEKLNLNGTSVNELLELPRTDLFINSHCSAGVPAGGGAEWVAVPLAVSP